MRQSFRLSSLIPSGSHVENVLDDGERLVVTASGTAREALCLLCGTVSGQVHSRYERRASDLPCGGRKVLLRIVARRFRCPAPHCRRQIFAERFPGGILPLRSRRTMRLECIVHHLGLALGGRPGAKFARRLMLPVSNDTLLRVVRRLSSRPAELPRVVGLDDWAFRRNHSYGSILCDLERRRILALLPDREIATVERWFAGRRSIEIVSRDRGGGYGEAVAKALPEAVQVADRWHLMENASSAFLDAVRKSMRAIRTTLGATTIDLTLLTAAEKLQYEGYLRREDTSATILALAKEGTAIKEIVRRTGHSRKLVRQTVRGERTDIFRTRQSSLDLHLPLLDEQWASGCRIGAELWRRLQARGFRGSLRVVGEWATRRRRAERAGDRLHRVPSARTIARLMTTARDHLSKADTVMITAIENGIPTLVEARTLLDRFHAMIRRRSADLEGWISDATPSLIASFASGIRKDRHAVAAAVTLPWSNGRTEGQITKLVKRQMYGRAKLD